MSPQRAPAGEGTDEDEAPDADGRHRNPFVSPDQPREQRSLFGEILDWMLAPLLLLWPMSVGLTWLIAQSIANKPFDRDMGDTARYLARQVKVQSVGSAQALTRFAWPAAASEILRSDETDEVFYQVRNAQGELLSGDPTIPAPHDESRAPAGELHFRDDTIQAADVRVAYLWIDVPGRPGETAALVQVAETLGKRSRLATEIIKGVILPQFVILPLAVLLVWLALARGIAPLNALQQRIRRRQSGDLSPIDVREAPEEVAPLVTAINELLGRLDQSISTQKHFLADAAHQLKTPLAGLRMQAELAQQEIDAGHADPQSLKRSLQQISRSTQRAAHMVNQLLAMARAENTADVVQHKPVSLERLATETVHDFVPKAMEKRIDLGYEGPATRGERRGPMVMGNALLLRELIRNLVDNALQYTPPGGTVTARVIHDPFGRVAMLQVEDSGPGIPADEREKVFAPFYRALGTNVDGSGLGLAIVREIAEQHGAEVTLDEAHPRHPVPKEFMDNAASAAGVGALFTLKFKALPAEPEPSPSAPQSADLH
ncbi:MAG: hypothetical protein RJA98_3354 [Pseudomonadota bacterium]